MAELINTHLTEVINPSWNFSGRLVTPEMHQQNALVGLASEAGELLDIGKKQWFHLKQPDGHFRDKMLSEFGDIFYYLVKAMDLYGFSLKEVLDYNRKKLESRHPELGVVTERFGKEAIQG
jgi:NTP pyrophosphatase (non-canonical NTP hydrolase)